MAYFLSKGAVCCRLNLIYSTAVTLWASFSLFETKKFAAARPQGCRQELYDVCSRCFFGAVRSYRLVFILFVDLPETLACLKQIENGCDKGEDKANIDKPNTPRNHRRTEAG